MTANLVFRPIRELAELLRAKQVSPVELAELSLQRLEELGRRYNAVVTVTHERALRQARRAEQEIMSGAYRGMLHGIPYGAKDLLATSEGIPTTWGAAPFRNQVFDYDASLVKRLEEAGAVLVAKLAMVELAGGMGYRHPDASFTGPALCPWDPATWTGGSSSGSGAGVAAGLVPLAIGSETWGSILGPANNCGVAGLRPTYGRVSRAGAMALSWTMDKLGPLALTADDCGIALEAMAGYDPDDASTIREAFRYDADRPSHRFRLGMLRDVAKEAQEPVRANFEAALKALETIADIEEVTLEDLPYESMSRTIINAESASAFQELIEDGRAAGLTATSSRVGLYSRVFIPAVDYLKALRIRRVAAKSVDRAMSGFDAWVAPARPGVAPPIDREFRGVFSPGGDVIGGIGNGLGLPGISVPSGFSDQGLPTGIQFMGRAYSENGVLAVARAYQGMTEWHLRHPADVMPSN